MKTFKNIYIYGAGGLGREVHQLIDQINLLNNEWYFMGYIDDTLIPGTVVNNKKVLGGRDYLQTIKGQIFLVIAIASPNVIRLFTENNSNLNIHYPNLIHPSVDYDLYNFIGMGNLITSNCIFTRNISIGNFNIFNTRVSIGHDVSVSDYNVFQPNVQISGNVRIGNCNYFGVNSLVLANLKIGNNNKIGAMSMLVKSINDFGNYFGIPAMKRNF
jgi:sugar O-acyltransferase (sialic acid O-acetyltransferase NeuD family)